MQRLCLLSLCFAVTGATTSAAEPEMKRVEWKVGERLREALVCAPANATTTARPLVFVYHGHGGTMRHASRSIGVHTHWPEAICVYPQGLNTPVKLTDPEGKKSGWQITAGEQNDRDLNFFDAMLKSLRADYKVDERRVYVTGHSNGGRFTQLLWAERGGVFAAVAPSGTTAAALTKSFEPKPCLHIAGEKDELVKFAWQKQTMEAVRKLNGCESEGTPWDKEKTPAGVLYASKAGTPFVELVYPGGHTFPADGAARIVTFFKQHAKK
ncbi:dienelactone hydrolase family protein [Gemmata sp. JC717]|uniref:alpha/beta hydrolase family esterase n=1 Tax=Gemmata algarum TaxID=2975278 RepID=UPI0021BAFEE7|nr:dienelactone hydrolase family protein [Gemmata algarum]MDY3553960.1 dienelactone hydrolase family protein [Gemmata algarum]